MHIERINDNTIRVSLDADELAQRGVEVLNLLGDREQVQEFFYSILAEVDVDHEFMNETTPVTFQVMPNHGGLELLISKRLDGNFSEQDFFSQMLASHQDYEYQDDDSGDLENDQLTTNDLTSDILGIPRDANKVMFAFDDLNDLIGLAESLKASDLASALYTFKGRYFIELSFLDDRYDELTPADAWAIAGEYGTPIPIDQVTAMKQDLKVLIERDALASLRYYFK